MKVEDLLKDERDEQSGSKLDVEGMMWGRSQWKMDGGLYWIAYGSLEFNGNKYSCRQVWDYVYETVMCENTTTGRMNVDSNGEGGGLMP